ncbi:hypothetical protein OG21DRAFT_1425988 [Imleria badia]|nr:hypothetical protein OG21DRAFT_1425988 [Imleria badia]
MDSAGIQSYILSLLTATNSRGTWIVDQFAALVRNGSIPNIDEWMQIVLDCIGV